MTVTCHRIPGELPPFWQERRAIFFANLLSLFFGNEMETEALKKEVGRIDSYGGRLAPIIDTLFQGGNNLLVVDQQPDEALVNYFSETLGLGIPELGPILSCNRDFCFAEGFNEAIRLTRTQTIMEGRTHCDFRFEAGTSDEATKQPSD